MLLSSPTNSQEAPVDKVTSVSLPVCQPGMKTDQTADSRLGNAGEARVLHHVHNDDLTFMSEVMDILAV